MENPMHESPFLRRVLPVVAPVLLISIGYVDPGKWVATIEGGARFGFDLVSLMLVFNFVSIMCQYLSARIGVVARKDLAQICSEEYNNWTSMFLRVQAEFSVAVMDLTMMLGVAHCLSLLLRMDLSACVFLSTITAALFPLLDVILENRKTNILYLSVAGFIMILYVIGVLLSQPEFPLSMSGRLTKLNGENIFTVMSLLGTSIMPHNFYLHSSLVQRHQVPSNISKSALCHDHFFAILCIFSGIYMVKFVFMTSAANVFNSTGVVLLTFQDALSLIEQVFRVAVSPFALSLVLFFSNQITTLTWNSGGNEVVHNFFQLEIPDWLHHATIRIIAAIPALYCVWTSGAEGIFQLLIFTQVMVALLLPSSVIPLFRIASSRPIMGNHKISQSMEFLVLIVFIGILGLEIIFIAEMMFGNSDWVNNLRWNLGNGSSIPYLVLLSTACSSFCLTLWLAATPLKSASARFDMSVRSSEALKSGPDESLQWQKNDLSDRTAFRETTVEEDTLPSPNMAVENFDHILLEKRKSFDQESRLTTIEENNSNFKFLSPSPPGHSESVSTGQSEFVPVLCSEAPSETNVSVPETMKIKPTEPIEKTVGGEGPRAGKDDHELSKDIPGSISLVAHDGPASLKSLSGMSDEGGNGGGSLSRLAGLGRAGRRQLATVLDEFWKQLYDYHGQVTEEAKAKKLDVVLGIDSKVVPSSLKVETSGKEFRGQFSSDSSIAPSLYDSPKQQKLQQSIDSSYGVQRGPTSLLSNQMQSFEAYVQNSSRNVHDSTERRYTSLRTLPSSDSRDYQPATVHGYQIASYMNRASKDRCSDILINQMESSTQHSPSVGPTNYRDPVAFSSVQKLHSGFNMTPVTQFQNNAVSRVSPSLSGRQYYDYSFGPADSANISANTKKYHSSPDISGLSLPHSDLVMSGKSAHWNNSVIYGTSASRRIYEQYPFATSVSKAAPPGFGELSPSKPYRDPMSFQFSNTGSIWSQQPFEQFGVAAKTKSHVAENDETGARSSSFAQEPASTAHSEHKLLQSFRLCVYKLLKLEGSDWLFSQNDGADEDLIDRVAARERFLYEVENRVDLVSGSSLKNSNATFLISSVPQCGDDCIWKADLIISFGVWCIHRILELSLMESRPELWGKYTYVLNLLQGIIEPAFSKPRNSVTPCFCLEIPEAHQHRSSPPVGNGLLPPTAKSSRGKTTTSAMLLELVKDVEISISCRKGRSGTAAGDVAFPKGKENLASVLKRYKRRLFNSSKPVVTHEASGTGSRKLSPPPGFGL